MSINGAAQITQRAVAVPPLQPIRNGSPPDSLLLHSTFA